MEARGPARGHGLLCIEYAVRGLLGEITIIDHATIDGMFIWTAEGGREG